MIFYENIASLVCMNCDVSWEVMKHLLTVWYLWCSLVTCRLQQGMKFLSSPWQSSWCIQKFSWLVRILCPPGSHKRWEMWLCLWDAFKNLGQKSAFLRRFQCLSHHWAENLEYFFQEENIRMMVSSDKFANRCKRLHVSRLNTLQDIHVYFLDKKCYIRYHFWNAI